MCSYRFHPLIASTPMTGENVAVTLNNFSITMGTPLSVSLWVLPGRLHQKKKKKEYLP